MLIRAETAPRITDVVENITKDSVEDVYKISHVLLDKVESIHASAENKANLCNDVRTVLTKFLLDRKPGWRQECLLDIQKVYRKHMLRDIRFDQAQITELIHDAEVVIVGSNEKTEV